MAYRLFRTGKLYIIDITVTSFSINIICVCLFRKIMLRPDTLKRIEKDTNPAASALNFMLSRAIGVDELYESFEKLKVLKYFIFNF